MSSFHPETLKQFNFFLSRMTDLTTLYAAPENEKIFAHIKLNCEKICDLASENTLSADTENKLAVAIKEIQQDLFAIVNELDRDYSPLEIDIRLCTQRFADAIIAVQDFGFACKYMDIENYYKAASVKPYTPLVHVPSNRGWLCQTTMANLRKFELAFNRFERKHKNTANAAYFHNIKLVVAQAAAFAQEDLETIRQQETMSNKATMDQRLSQLKNSIVTQLQQLFKQDKTAKNSLQDYCFLREQLEAFTAACKYLDITSEKKRDLEKFIKARDQATLEHIINADVSVKQRIEEIRQKEKHDKKSMTEEDFRKLQMLLGREKPSPVVLKQTGFQDLKLLLNKLPSKGDNKEGTEIGRAKQRAAALKKSFYGRAVLFFRHISRIPHNLADTIHLTDARMPPLQKKMRK